MCVSNFFCLLCLFFFLLSSWRPCWECPSLRWASTTVPTQTAVSLEAAVTRFPSARPRWLSAPVTSLWCRCRRCRGQSVAAGVERPSTCPAPPTPPTPASTGAPARTDRWGTGECREGSKGNKLWLGLSALFCRQSLKCSCPYNYG